MIAPSATSTTVPAVPAGWSATTFAASPYTVPAINGPQGETAPATTPSSAMSNASHKPNIWCGLTASVYWAKNEPATEVTNAEAASAAKRGGSAATPTLPAARGLACNARSAKPIRAERKPNVNACATANTANAKSTYGHFFSNCKFRKPECSGKK
jgi:hypothetical protein